MATFFTFEQRERVGERSGHSHISLPLIASREHGGGKGGPAHMMSVKFSDLFTPSPL